MDTERRNFRELISYCLHGYDNGITSPAERAAWATATKVVELTMSDTHQSLSPPSTQRISRMSDTVFFGGQLQAVVTI